VLTETGHKRDLRRTTLKGSVKLLRLVLELLRNKSKPEKSRNRKRRRVKRQLKRRLKKRKRNLQHREQSWKRHEKGKGSYSCNLKASEMTRPPMRKDLKPSLLRERKQLQPIVKSSQAFLRRQRRLRQGHLRQAAFGIRRLSQVLPRKSLGIRTSKSFQYLRLLSRVLLQRPRHHRLLCLRRKYYRLHHQHQRSSHQRTRSIALRNRKLLNRSRKRILVPNLVGVRKKTSGLLPNRTRTIRVTMEKTLPLAVRPNTWRQFCSVPWPHPDHYPQWTASPQRQCKTARRCPALSNPARRRLLHPHRPCLTPVRQVRRRLHRQCPDLQLLHPRRCRTVLRLVDRRHEQQVVVGEALPR
jgi:hypothetical protein